MHAVINVMNKNKAIDYDILNLFSHHEIDIHIICP